MTVDEARDFLISISYNLGNMGVEYLTEKDGEKMREAINVLEQQTSKNGTRYVKQLKPVVISHGGMGFRDVILPLGDFDWYEEDEE